MKLRSDTLIQQIAAAVLRVLCLAVPIIIALSAVVLIARYGEHRGIIPSKHVPGATDPASN
jgi:hypothetical protein